MKNLFYLLLTIPFFLASCSNEDMTANEETVQVSFCAELPQLMGTRASSTLSVNKVYCAVFENDEEIENLREEIDIVDGQSIIFSPRLIKGRTYDIVFWASKDGSYDVTDMTAITRNPNKAEEDYDAFTETTPITVVGNYSEGITLKRPLAQLNIGVTEEDWNGVANPSTFNMEPGTITIEIDGKSTFNALSGETIGTESKITYNLSVSGTEFTCNGNTYKNIATCFILSESEKETKDFIYSIYAQSGVAIRENVKIPSVPLQRNYKTNLVGGLLTGVVSYTISIENDFNTSNEHYKEIE